LRRATVCSGFGHRGLSRLAKGQQLFLKIDVVEVNFGVRGVDATNIYQDGTVSYRARVNTLSQIQASTGEDFAEDARIQTANTEDCFFCAVRRLERGAQVRIHKMKIKEKQVDVELDKASGAKHEIHLKFSSADYTIDEIVALSGKPQTRIRLGSTDDP
jgi:hypothetical protein